MQSKCFAEPPSDLETVQVFAGVSLAELLRQAESQGNHSQAWPDTRTAGEDTCISDVQVVQLMAFPLRVDH